jgi:VWFA-related protein
VLEETRNAIAAATRGDVNIYAVDPRGLHPDGEDLIETSNTFDAPSGANGGLQSLREERETAQDTLRDLAASTGGFAAANTNNLDGAFDRIVRENSTYYLIGYASRPNQATDGGRTFTS